MSAALEYQETARERLLETVLDQLELLFAPIYEGDQDLARQAAMDAMEPYARDDRTDLAVAAQIIACGLTAMRVFQQCMRPEINEAELARLTRIADTLGRTEQRHRKTGLYPNPPAQPKRQAPPAPKPEAVTEPATKQPAPVPGSDKPPSHLSTAARPASPSELDKSPSHSPTATPPSSPSWPGVSRPPTHDIAATQTITVESLKEQILASSSMTPPRA
jgi:hypothetical protein